MDIVFATATVIVADPQTGGSVAIVHGTHWPADDPVVRAYPTHFTNDPRYGLASSRPLGADGYPESATAAPGEKRSRGRVRNSEADEK